jgi:hypothetical protein
VRFAIVVAWLGVCYAQSPRDRAFDDFFASASPAEADRRAEAVLATGV